MFDIGFGEMILLAAIALIAIGPKQLPEVARVIGRMLNEFKRATGDFTRTFVDARDSATSILNESEKALLQEAPPPVTQPPAAAESSHPSNEIASAHANANDHDSGVGTHEHQMAFDLHEPAPHVRHQFPLQAETSPILKKENSNNE